MELLRRLLDKESARLLKHSSWVLAANSYGTGLAFLRSVLIARGLGASLFGSYSIIIAFVGMVQELLNLNLGTALIRFGAGYQTQGRNDKLVALLKTCLKVSVLMLIVCVAVVALLLFVDYRGFIDRPGLTAYIIAYAFASGMTYFNSISRSMLRLHYRFRISSLIEMLMDSIETVAIGWAAWFHPKDLDVFFPTLIVVRFLNGFICNFIAFAELRAEWRPHVASGKEIIAAEVKPIRAFVIANSLGNTLKTLISQGDILLLGVLASPVQVAYYVIAKKTAYAVLTLSDPLTSSIYPQLSKLCAERKFVEIRVMLRKITRLAVIPSLLAFIALFFINHWLLVRIYGAEYAAASDSFMYFFTGALLGAVTFWTIPLVQSLGMVRLRITAYVVTILLGSAISYLAVPVLGAQGMSMALLLANILNATIFIRFSFLAMRKAEEEALVL